MMNARRREVLGLEVDGAIPGMPTPALWFPGVTLDRHRWFAGKGRRITGERLIDIASLPDLPQRMLAIVEIQSDDGQCDRYFLPFVTWDAACESPAPIIGLDCHSLIRDALADVEFCREMLRLVERGATFSSPAGGTFEFRPSSLSTFALDRLDSLDVLPSIAEQSNTSVIYGEALILKVFRRLRSGVNPEVEILRFLTKCTEFRGVPRLAGTVEHLLRDERHSLAVLQEFVPNVGDGWAYTLEYLCRSKSLRHSDYLSTIADLGTITAGLHLALASERDHPDFAPQPITEEDVSAWQLDVDTRLRRVLARLDCTLDSLPASTREVARLVLANQSDMRRTLAGLGELGAGLAKSRLHGDYHLGQVLKTARGWVIIDFEGEPLRPIAERRAHHTPLKDVAGMMRSFNYARHAAARDGAGVLDDWEPSVRHAFLSAYLADVRAGAVPLLPDSDEALQRILAALELEKALYELEYELGNRPGWVSIPLAFLASSLGES